MGRRILEHKDFTGGDWGRRQPWTARKNQFKALNMLLYSTGELGVRPGLQNITPTNVSLGSSTFSVAKGIAGDVFSSTYYYGQNVSGGLPVMKRATSYKNQAQSTMGNTFSGSITRLYYSKQGTPFLGNAWYILEPTRGVYSLISTTLTQLNALAGTENNGVALYGDRLVVGQYVDAGNPRSNIRYNGLTAGVSDLTSWPVANIIPVGDRNEDINNLYPQRGHLAIMKTTNGFFHINGSLGVSESLRRTVNTIGPSETALASCITENDSIWYVADNRHRIPAMYDGTQVAYFEDQLLPIQGNGLVSMTGISVTDPQGVAIALGTSPVGATSGDTTKLHIYHRGVWTRHELPDLGVDTQVTCTTNQSIFDPGIDVSNPFTTPPENTPYLLHDVPCLVFCDNRATTPAFYSMLLDLDRPGWDWQDITGEFVIWNAEMPGDNSLAQVSGSVELPEVHLEDADEFQVQGVIVDFRSWNTRGSLTNHFDIKVDCLRPHDNTSPITSLTSAWDQAGSLSSSGGTIQRETFMFGEQGYGNGYQLKLTNIRGVAIQRIQVIIDTVKFRGV